MDTTTKTNLLSGSPRRRAVSRPDEFNPSKLGQKGRVERARDTAFVCARKGKARQGVRERTAVYSPSWGVSFASTTLSTAVVPFACKDVDRAAFGRMSS